MRFILGLLASLWSGLASADPTTQAERLAARADIPGAVAGWVQAEAMQIGAAGLRTAGGDGVEAGDPWHIGSLTKSMTAVLAARLVERGLITWDSTVGEVLAVDGP